MYKMASKMPVIPRSLILHGVKVNHSCLSWGGFANIFKGEFEGAPVALKLLRDAKHNVSLVSFKKNNDIINHAESSLRWQNLYREALTWRSLRHDNVLSFLGICEGEHLSFLVSPFMKGGTLSEWRHKFDWSPPMAEIQNNVWFRFFSPSIAYELPKYRPGSASSPWFAIYSLPRNRSW